MPASYIVSNESDYLASTFAISTTSGKIQSSESNYLSSNIGISSVLANIIISENTYLVSDVGIQTSQAQYPYMFIVSSTEKQSWVS